MTYAIKTSNRVNEPTGGLGEVFDEEAHEQRGLVKSYSKRDTKKRMTTGRGSEPGARGLPDFR